MGDTRSTTPSGRLIVSVQAPEGSPLRQPDVIAALSEACLGAGAAGVRLDGPEAIAAVRRRCPQALIVGLWKRMLPDSSVYITPRWQDLRQVWAAGADVIALDATSRPRPGGEGLAELVVRAREELQAVLMADVDGIDSGLQAAELGCQWVGTTLYGYTEATRSCAPPALQLLPELRRRLPEGIRLICEGGLSSPAQATEACRLGADAVVVGTALTGLEHQVSTYRRQLDPT
ncbi:N-acetylmannosamine-6-phosphate 2-epimerase [Synechococcus sp. RSCCF101]|uniref:N-acetylmannosamine-6-phosphate 2-epimerase n=1 Tax=Synechococcus sp. RSCCF101 TaxID=2511069 RepID=UPI001243D30B|nr:N-acetylmannosamine-6-phosphate 2-epimerase [Synechococcus sp. RSCCF101]QEY30949.1 N-acetylmannosamine-6-phosphate 2-epimerase [Synechococcus sp. RSCCF101]